MTSSPADPPAQPDPPPRVHGVNADQILDSAVISSLTRTEVRSLLSRRRRMGELTAELKSLLFAAFVEDSDRGWLQHYPVEDTRSPGQFLAPDTPASGRRNPVAGGLLVILMLWLCPAPRAQAEDAAIAALFTPAGVEGTLVIESVNSGTRYVHHDARARQAFIAASTFKVFNTLIAVEEGAIAAADAPLRWDGTWYDFPDWNRDQTLATAFKVSCVWCYQELARRVGAGKYPAYLRLAGYGQLQEPFAVSTFWLDGALTISAEQQVAFLRQVVQRRLPFRPSTYETLAAIMRADAGPDYRLYAKTGWSTRTTPGIGWYIGYVERGDDTWLFALNLDTKSASDLPLRQQITLDALRIKGILPPLPVMANEAPVGDPR